MTDSEETAYSYMSYRVMRAMLDDAIDGNEEALFAFLSITEDQLWDLLFEQRVELRNRLQAGLRPFGRIGSIWVMGRIMIPDADLAMWKLDPDLER
jgi:hypothetical protein